MALQYLTRYVEQCLSPARLPLHGTTDRRNQNKCRVAILVPLFVQRLQYNTDIIQAVVYLRFRHPEQR